MLQGPGFLDVLLDTSDNFFEKIIIVIMVCSDGLNLILANVSSIIKYYANKTPFRQETCGEGWCP